jgi:predicted SnoaL-like aldol condensation-catalyzing enzyme
MSELQRRKQAVIRLLEIAFDSKVPLARKRVEMARYIDPAQYIQHSPGIADGLQALLQLIEQFDRDFPGYAIEVKRVIAEGDLAFAHCHYTFGPRDPRGKAIAEIFRFDGELIVEHWDVIQDVPAQSVNDNGMF